MRHACSVPGLRRALRIPLALVILLAAVPWSRGAAADDFDLCAAALERYVVDAPGDSIAPRSVVSVDPAGGSILDPAALLAADGRAAIITRAESSPAIVVDFGRVVSGRLALATLRSDPPQPRARIAVSESLRFLGPDSDTTWGDQHTTLWLPPAGPATFETGQLTFRYVLLALDEGGSFAVDALWLHSTAVAGRRVDYAGCFDSSDDELNHIWYAGAYTLGLNTVPGPDGGATLVDGAKRDRMVWAADLAVQSRVEYLTFGQTAPVRSALADLAAHQRPDGSIPPSPYGGYGLVLYDYCAWWVSTVADYLRYTGDASFVRTLYSNVQRQMDWFPSIAGPDGLLVKDQGLEWAYTLQRTGAVTYLNVVYYRALLDAAEIAAVLGHPEDAVRWGESAARIRSAVTVRLFDASRGVFVDSSDDSLHTPQDANVLAIVSGLAARERWPGMLERIRAAMWTPYGSATVDLPYGLDTWHDRRIWPFMGFFEVEARFLAGDDAGAWDLLRREWGRMLHEDPASTTWEWMTADGEPENGFASLAHGWSAGATVALTEYALGVRSTQPGYVTFEVDPHPGDLDWAAGRVPVPAGAIELTWRRFEDGFSEHLRVPEGSTARVHVPITGDGDVVLVNGEPAWESGVGTAFDAEHGDAAVMLELPAGVWDVLSTPDWSLAPETGQYLAAPFRGFWARNGGLPVFGLPLTHLLEEADSGSETSRPVQYVERQRLEYHAEHAGTPYEVELGLLGVADATRRGLAGSASFAEADGPPGPGCSWFEATDHSLCGIFRSFWISHGLDFGDPGISERESLALFGYPISEPFTDPSSGLTVQYFERARFEWHPENAGTPYEVLLGRLAAEMLGT